MSRFVKNPRLEEELSQLPGLIQAAHDIAERTAQIARRIAPRGDSPAGEHYTDMIDVEIASEKGRPVVRVVANKDTSVHIEFGTSDTPVFAPLRRAAMSVGRLK